MDDEQLLNDIYYKKHNFDGVNNLYLKARVTNKDISKEFVKEWLNKQATQQQNSTSYTKKKVFLPIYSESPYSFQIDLTFFPRYKKYNDDYYVLFTAININTRYAYAYYTKTKDMDTILDIMKIFKKDAIEINNITTDEGTEFYNNKFLKFCEDNNITVFFAKGDSHKLGIINRFHRTIKEKILKYFTASDTVNWINVIGEIIYNYNHSVHRGIGIEPYKVNNFLESELIAEKRQATDNIKSKIPIIKIGDKCRIKNISELFDDKMTTRFSNDIYEITKVNKNTVKIIDKNNIDYTVKQSDILIVHNNTELNTTNEHQMAVKQVNKTNNILRKEGLNTNNIVETKRIRKPKVYTDFI